MSFDRDTQEERLESVMPLLRRLAADSARRGGDMDEAISEALWLWLAADRSHDPGRGAYSTWVWTKVYFGLAERRREEARHARLSPAADPTDLDSGHAGRKTFNPSRLAAELSPAGAAALGLVASPKNPEAYRIVEATVRPGVVRESRRSVAAGLMLELGWAGREVARAFAEVREALEGMS